MTTDNLSDDDAAELAALAQSARATIARLRGQCERQRASIVAELRRIATQWGGSITPEGNAYCNAALAIERRDDERTAT